MNKGILLLFVALASVASLAKEKERVTVTVISRADSNVAYSYAFVSGSTGIAQNLNLQGATLTLQLPSVVRQTERRLFRVRRARFTFSRISAARAVQMNGFGLSLWRSM
jgi:hypothetical protein